MDDLIDHILNHRDFSAKDREKMAEKGQAMVGGGFPIRNKQDLKNAIQAIGRAKNYEAAKAHIIKRARALGLTDLLPDGWVKSEVEQTIDINEFLEHHGIKGMRWGVRRSKSQLSRAGGGKSVKDMSDDELRAAVNRLNMEQQYTRLTSGNVSSRNKKLIVAGAGFAASIAGNVARQQIQNHTNAQVGKQIAKLAAKRAARKALKSK